MTGRPRSPGWCPPWHQGRGLATEAATAMVGLPGRRRRTLGSSRTSTRTTTASAAVAARLGLRRTDVVEDGEVRVGPRRRGRGRLRGEWQAGDDAREERLRDPHGWLAITAIHWLSPAPQRFDDVPGAWSGDERRRHRHARSGARPSAAGRRHPHRRGAPVRAARRARSDRGLRRCRRPGGRARRPRPSCAPAIRTPRTCGPTAARPAIPPDPAWVAARAASSPTRTPDGDAVGEVVFASRRHRASAGRLGRGGRRASGSCSATPRRASRRTRPSVSW